MRRILLAALGLALLVSGCTSPEASRNRGDPGADLGNRTPVIDIHGPVDPGHDTPSVGKSTK